MTSRNWVKLFLSTLLVGSITTGISGFIVKWHEFSTLFKVFDFIEIISVLLWLIGVGMIFSLLSQAGFFAYLTIHRFGLAIFKSVFLWNKAQLIITFLVLFDLVYLRYKAFAEKGENILPYFGFAFFILIVGVFIAILKVKQTKKDAFIPALFFMIVVTILEWVPVLRVNEESWLYLMLIPLLVCNAYQLLVLHKLNENSKEHKNKKENQKLA